MQACCPSLQEHRVCSGPHFVAGHLPHQARLRLQLLAVARAEQQFSLLSCSCQEAALRAYNKSRGQAQLVGMGAYIQKLAQLPLHTDS